MRTTTLITLALAAATPALGQGYQYTCYYVSKTDQGAVPDRLKFKCEVHGGKETVCTELALSDCLGVDMTYGSLEARDPSNEAGLFPFPHGCQGCKWDAKETTINCRCKNKDDTLAYPSAVYFDNILSNHDGTLVGSVPQCRSKSVSC